MIVLCENRNLFIVIQFSKSGHFGCKFACHFISINIHRVGRWPLWDTRQTGFSPANRQITTEKNKAIFGQSADSWPIWPVMMWLPGCQLIPQSNARLGPRLMIAYCDKTVIRVCWWVSPDGLDKLIGQHLDMIDLQLVQGGNLNFNMFVCITNYLFGNLLITMLHQLTTSFCSTMKTFRARPVTQFQIS